MSDLERILQNTPGSVSNQWYEAGEAVDPGTVTVNVTRADGTSVVTGGAVSGAGTGARTYSILAAVTATLDTLRIEWVSSDKGTLVSYVEVVGGFLFTLAELAAVKPTSATWTVAQMADMRTTVEEAIEDEYGTAIVPRYKYETINGDGSALLQLRQPVRAIRSASVDGTALTVADIDIGGYGVYYPAGWRSGFGNITVGYEYGRDRPPGRMKLDAINLAKQWLTRGPIDDRAATFNAGADGGTYSLVVPGRNGSIFGLPDLDAVINASPYRVGVA